MMIRYPRTKIALMLLAAFVLAPWGGEGPLVRAVGTLGAACWVAGAILLFRRWRRAVRLHNERHRYLVGLLGPELVARMNADEVDIERIWSALNRIETMDGPNTARAWAIGLNPMLGDKAPVEVVREGRAVDAMMAAWSYQ